LVLGGLGVLGAQRLLDKLRMKFEFFVGVPASPARLARRLLTSQFSDDVLERADDFVAVDA
jgi:hypothetical protein